MTMDNITVYSSNMCGACEMVKAFLALRKVTFIERNVSTDLEGRKELMKMGYATTPVTVIGDIHISGFDAEQIDEALNGPDTGKNEQP